MSARAVTDMLRPLIAARAGGARPQVLVGLAGRGIAASRTPAMHEREAARLGLSAAYVLIDFDALGLADEALGEVVAAAAALGFAGLNVTFPFKRAVMAHLARLSDDAAAIGAVNTVVFGPAGASGHNTDCWGFEESFRAGLAGVSLGTVALVGAGGAGGAVAYALIELGGRDLRVFDTDSARAAELAARFDGHLGAAVRVVPDVASALAGAAGVVNTTPVGMAKFPGSPVPAALLRPPLWVADVVYFPPETEFLRAARAAGCRVLPGIGMAIGQAVRAFELFTGLRADVAAMTRHFEAAA